MWDDDGRPEWFVFGLILMGIFAMIVAVMEMQ